MTAYESLTFFLGTFSPQALPQNSGAIVLKCICGRLSIIIYFEMDDQTIYPLPMHNTIFHIPLYRNYIFSNANLCLLLPYTSSFWQQDIQRQQSSCSVVSGKKWSSRVMLFLYFCFQFSLVRVYLDEQALQCNLLNVHLNPML